MTLPKQVVEYRRALGRFAKYHAKALAKIDPAFDFKHAHEHGSIHSIARHHLEMLNRIGKLMDVEYALTEYDPKR